MLGFRNDRYLSINSFSDLTGMNFYLVSILAKDVCLLSFIFPRTWIRKFTFDHTVWSMLVPFESFRTLLIYLLVHLFITTLVSRFFSQFFL